MNYKVVFKLSAKAELDDLDKGMAILIIKKIKQLELNPNLGKPLGNKYNIDLTGYYKIYVFIKKFRIIYSIKEEILIIEIVAIGKRDKLELYKNVLK